MASLYKKLVPITDPTTGEKVKNKSKKWWGRYRDASGVERRVPLARDKTAAQAMLNDLLRKVDREKAGLVDPTEEQRKRPLVEHVVDFHRYLKNKGVTPKQVHTATTQLRCMIAANKWELVGDISAAEAINYLGGLREAGKSAQTYNHYLKSAKQFTRWLVRERRSLVDPLAHLSKLNVSIDRRHDRRALTTEEFTLLIEATHNGRVIEAVPGPDRAMMYVLAGWTGFRKGEIGSLTRRSFRLDDEPATVTVAACYSKRKRQDTQILHPEVVRRLKSWLATKPKLSDDDLFFPVSGRVPGGKERKTHKMMKLDLEVARTKWIADGETAEEKERRAKSDFLRYESEGGLFADFHSHRHLFITSLELAGLSPKMAQTLARHSDVRLTLGIYTHVGLHDQTAAIQSLPAPPSIGPKDEAAALRATGTNGQNDPAAATKRAPGVVPKLVPRGAQMGAEHPAPQRVRIAPDCIEGSHEHRENGDRKIVVNPNAVRTFRTQRGLSASDCSDRQGGRTEVSPTGFEPVTFGSGGRRRDCVKYICDK